MLVPQVRARSFGALTWVQVQLSFYVDLSVRQQVFANDHRLTTKTAATDG
jgi:hypothetical protein